ncbi:hypothetical protein CH333_01180 [candidate division WOR-3 bacterium JGI_Cruoil_03_44_89]|uniref:Uncharacterized protein n=1 Tax=candidate division WOR-3 bacterium JGI_Cruoil_03_44_89 TaxID=1973748 RepID=A0A235BYW4_UNCW3|nr:MAG: hypothetical protein CH333_01180 [candidate division WOR-3 bacterium JGI_Cruoil_03_44_89]
MPAAGTEITKNLTLVDIATASHAVLIHLNEFSYRAVVRAVASFLIFLYVTLHTNKNKTTDRRPQTTDQRPHHTIFRTNDTPGLPPWPYQISKCKN